MKKRRLFLMLAIFVSILFLGINSVQADQVLEETIPGGTATEKALNTVKVNCGTITGIPEKIPEITRTIVTIIQVAVPIVLVIVGMMDLFKGLSAQKEDEIKKGRQMFVKRLIIGAIIFFVIVITKALISLIADDKKGTIQCIDCFLSNSNSCIKE